MRFNKQYKPVSFSMTKKEKEEILRRSEEAEMSASEYVRAAIKYYIANSIETVKNGDKP